MARHSATATEKEAPLLTEFLALGPDERWLDQSPETMLATFPWFHGEAFDRIVEDLLALGPEPVVAEGFRLLPDLVAPLIPERSHAVWLLPTPEFRRTVFDSRGGPSWSFIGTTSRPEQALENLLVRDAMFTARLAQDTARLGLEVVRVDGSVSEDALVERLADTFGYAEP